MNHHIHVVLWWGQVWKREGRERDTSRISKACKYKKQIDQMVYKLYNLTPEEIAIVEGLDIDVDKLQ
ncbi:MAG: hypothetical protein A2W63_01070 [Deltaproteobacteria bacterium RIFCSPLOWO2_02_44_9]|nr:MAG: hypothetical protein A2W63_01070 [Deltaproteobacteria bacterium RIFCSPLOWO2_02_44_9]